MAVTVTNQANPIANKLVQDTDADEVGAFNTTGAAGTLYYLEVDNTANSGQTVYLKMSEDVTGITVGTTAPHYAFMLKGGARRSFVFPVGLVFSAGFSHWCVTGAGTAGTTAPTNPVVVRYLTT
tara:strand:+ start:261 stop:632 length:372 start_codon:yes stop_codon:yes gene_type:complete